MLAYQQKFEGVERFSGTLRWQKQDGEIFGGNFVVEGEKFHITWDGGELYGDGEFEWEVLHRSHRIKKRFYDPLIAPAVVNVFRLLRLDMTAEPVMINQKDDQIVIEVEFGSSVIQGNHFFKIDPNTLLPESLKMNVAQDSYFEKTDYTRRLAASLPRPLTQTAVGSSPVAAAQDTPPSPRFHPATL